MSLKAVELQIAVPRTSEAGKYQSEHRQRNMNDQATLGHEASKETEAVRHRSTAVDESTEASVTEQEEQRQNEHSPQHRMSANAQDEQAAEHPAEHPYKGHHIDLSL